MSALHPSLIDEKYYSALKIQSLIRRFLVRSKILNELYTNYIKIYDPLYKKPYYYNKKTEESTWLKPVLFLKNDIMKLRSIYRTKKEALIVLQSFFRMYLARKKTRLLYQSIIIKIYDEYSGYFYYYNPKARTTHWTLPKFMNNSLEYKNEKKELKYNMDELIKLNRNYVKKIKRKNNKHQIYSFSDDEDEEIEHLFQFDKELIEYNKDSAKTKKNNDSDSENDSIISSSSTNSNQYSNNRYTKRKYPRSKMQKLVDTLEDNKEEIYELNLSNIGTKYLSNRIYDYEYLKYLNLSHNKLSKLDDNNFSYLTELVYLNLSYNRLTYLPSDFGELNNLQELYLNNNNLSSLPHTFFTIKSLIRLDLSHNNFTEIPIINNSLLHMSSEGDTSINLLKNLQYFNMSHNKLTEFPSNLCSLKKLEELNLSNNSITNIDNNINYMKNLKILILNNNKIKNIPVELLNLSLNTLNLNNNEIECLPLPLHFEPLNSSTLSSSSISPNKPFEISSLKYLFLANNKIKELNNSISIYNSLVELNLENNLISNIEENIFNKFTLLRNFNLSKNLINFIPENLFLYNISIISLNLSYNKLSSIPLSLIKCNKLQFLYLNNNNLTTLLNKIFLLLTNLIKLTLNNNQLNEITSSLFNIKTLKYFDISNNNIKIIPEEINNWTNLEYLNISFNSITILPNNISSLTNLEVFDLEHNLIETIPPSISALTKLKKFNLSYNNLLIKPNILSLLTNLIHCNLSWNKKLFKKISIFDTGWIKSSDNHTFFNTKINNSNNSSINSNYGNLNEDYFNFPPYSYIEERIETIQKEIDGIISNLSINEQNFFLNGHNYINKRKSRKRNNIYGDLTQNNVVILNLLLKFTTYFNLPREEIEKLKEYGSKNDNLNFINEKNFNLNFRKFKRENSNDENGSINQDINQEDLNNLVYQFIYLQSHYQEKINNSSFFTKVELDLYKLINYTGTLTTSLRLIKLPSGNLIDPNDLNVNVINSMFLGTELIKPFEDLLVVLDDLNYLACLEEIKYTQDKLGEENEINSKYCNVPLNSSKLLENFTLNFDFDLLSNYPHNNFGGLSLISNLFNNYYEDVENGKNYFPTFSYPYFVLLERDKEIFNYYNDPNSPLMNNPYESSLLNLFFDVFLLISKTLTTHAEFVQRNIRNIEREINSKSSVLPSLIQRDYYLAVQSNSVANVDKEKDKINESKSKFFKNTQNKFRVEKIPDQSDILEDITSELLLDQKAQEIKEKKMEKSLNNQRKIQEELFYKEFYSTGDLNINDIFDDKDFNVENYTQNLDASNELILEVNKELKKENNHFEKEEIIINDCSKEVIDTIIESNLKKNNNEIDTEKITNEKETSSPNSIKLDNTLEDNFENNFKENTINKDENIVEINIKSIDSTNNEKKKEDILNDSELETLTNLYRGNKLDIIKSEEHNSNSNNNSINNNKIQIPESKDDSFIETFSFDKISPKKKQLYSFEDNLSNQMEYNCYLDKSSPSLSSSNSFGSISLKNSFFKSSFLKSKSFLKESSFNENNLIMTTNSNTISTSKNVLQQALNPFSSNILPSTPTNTKNSIDLLYDENKNNINNNEKDLIGQKIGRSWIAVLNQYREFLLSFSLKASHSALNIFKLRGFDIHNLYWDKIYEKIQDPLEFYYNNSIEKYKKNKIINHNNEPSYYTNINHILIKPYITPLILYYFKEQTRKCLFYHAKTLQYMNLTGESLLSYEALLILYEGKLQKDTYINYLKVVLTIGNFYLAQDIINDIIEIFTKNKLEILLKNSNDMISNNYQKLLKLKNKKFFNSLDLSLLDLELSIFKKYTEIQIASLDHANVYSSTNRRIYGIQRNGMRGSAPNFTPLQISSLNLSDSSTFSNLDQYDDSFTHQIQFNIKDYNNDNDNENDLSISLGYHPELIFRRTFGTSKEFLNDLFLKQQEELTRQNLSQSRLDCFRNSKETTIKAVKLVNKFIDENVKLIEEENELELIRKNNKKILKDNEKK